MDILARVSSWFVSGDTGVSSKTIAAFMCGGNLNGNYNCAPADPADLGRCLRLLELFPEWKSRMPEMSSVNSEWAKIIPHWDEISAMMDDEVGIDWSKGTEAPRTYLRMREILR